jgi:hypothetical protein
MATNPSTGVYEWLIETYLANFSRSSSTHLVYNLRPWGNNITITVKNGTATVSGANGWTRDMNYQSPLTDN